jgi:transposase
MLSSEQGFRQIYVACGYTDLRHGIDGLSCIIQEQFRLSPFQKDVLFLSAVGVRTVSKAWPGKAMDSFSFTSGSRPEGCSGREPGKK